MPTYSKTPEYFLGLTEAYPSPAGLKEEVLSAAITEAIDNVRMTVAGTSFTVHFDFKSALTPASEAALNGVVQAHTGVFEGDQETKTTHDKLLATRALPYDPDREPFRVGYRFDIVPASLNIWDIQVTPQMVDAAGTVQLMGGRLWVPADTHADDYFDVVVVDKDGVVPDPNGVADSLMAAYGLPTDGSFALEVSAKIADRTNCPVGNPAGRGMNPGGNFEIFAGLYIRLKFQAHGATYSGPFKIDLNFAR